MIRKIASVLMGQNNLGLLARGTLQAFLIQGSGAVLLLLMEILAARILGTQQFGIYSLAMAWVYIFALLGTLGLNHAILKFVPIYFVTQQWSDLHGLLRYANILAGLLATIFVLLGTMVLLTLEQIPSEVLSAFLIAFLAIPVMVLSSLRQAVLRGLGKIAHALTPEFIVRPLAFIFLIVVGSRLIGITPDATMALSFNLVAVALAFLLGTFWQHKLLPTFARTITPTYHHREWMVMALPLLAIIGLNLLSSRVDIVMLGMFSENSNVAIYAAVSRIADVIVFGLVASNAIVAPMIARMYASGEHQELQKIVAYAAYGIALFTIPVALLIILFGAQILGFFGADFVDGHKALIILACGQIVNALAGPVGYLMMMTGHQLHAAKIVAASAIINVILNAILIPFYGLVGAATATAISTIFWNLLMLYFVKSKLGVVCSFIPLLLKRS
jgi:O-antigen/teichoic acid export membrane protein